MRIAEYSRNAASKFREEAGREFREGLTPFIADADWAEPGSTPAAHGNTCSSHVATALFLGRTGRPDIAKPVQRLCSAVSRWTTTEDAALIRLMAYLMTNSNMEIFSSLCPGDIAELVLRLYTDADWNGDAATTKSTNGCWLELYHPPSGRFWAVS